MDMPGGYVVDELPRSAKVSFNDGEGYFEYLIEKQADPYTPAFKDIFYKSQFYA